ncbi:hypothetical protein HC762_01830 [bacterium]|nr:hypothetical protein [bacterium]
MLATRAATNPELKALMKVVASSNATQDQLKLFQSHIDELNNMIRRQEQEQEQEREHEREQQQQQQQQTEPSLMKLHGDEIDSSVPNLPQQDGVGDMTGDLVDSFQSTGTATPPSSYVAHAQQSGYSLPSRQNSVGTSGSYGPTRNLSPFAQYPPQQQKVAMPEARIKAIVLEFTTPASSTIVPCQDRYLFPEYAVLDTPFLGQGLEMVCSFFVIRRGSDLLAQQSAEGAPAGTSVGGLTSWKAEEEYYQPVTLTIKTIHHRILETIARAAKPLAEVQDKMREIMQSKVRVKDDFLAMRLPKEKRTILESMAGRDGGFADSAIEIDDERAGSGDEDDELESFYGI